MALTISDNPRQTCLHFKLSLLPLTTFESHSLPIDNEVSELLWSFHSRTATVALWNVGVQNKTSQTYSLCGVLVPCRTFLPSWHTVLLSALSMTMASAQHYEPNDGVLGDFSSLDAMPAQLIFHHVARCAGIELDFETCALNMYIDTHIAPAPPFESQCLDMEDVLDERIANVVVNVASATFECNDGAATEDGIPDYTFDPVLINNVTTVLSNNQCWTELCSGEDVYLQVEAEWIEECADVQLPYPLPSSDEMWFGHTAEEGDALLTCMLDYVMESPPSEFDLMDPTIASEHQCYPPGFIDMQTHCPNVIGPRAFHRCKYLLEESPYEMEMDMSMSMNYNPPTPNPSTNSGNPQIDSFCGIMYDLSSDRGRKCLVPICDYAPTPEPSSAPTADGPTPSPTGFKAYPTVAPSSVPSCAPSLSPTGAPTGRPSFTAHPSASPSAEPSYSRLPSASPTSTPSSQPSYTAFPSASPTVQPSVSVQPSDEPSLSALPSATPSTEPSLSSMPSALPSAAPSSSPSVSPSQVPTSAPSVSPTQYPTSTPTAFPTVSPTDSPSASPYPTQSGPADQIITVELTSTMTLNVDGENVPQVGTSAFVEFEQVLENAILDSVSYVQGEESIAILSIDGVPVDGRRRSLRRLDETAATTTDGLEIEFHLISIRDCLVASSSCMALSQNVVKEYEDALEKSVSDGTMTSNVQREATEASVDVLEDAEVESDSYVLTTSSTTVSQTETEEDPLPNDPTSSSSCSSGTLSAIIVLLSAIFYEMFM
jgi:hypothetical protein